MIQKRPNSKAPRPRGRPKAKEKLEKLVAYMPKRELAKVKKAARAARARSFSSWVSQVLIEEASRAVRTGEIPLWVLDMPSAPRTKGPTLGQIIREERDSGW